MRDHRLVNLNFHEIVNYGGQPPVQAQQNPPITCYGYCVSCEESGVLQQEQVGGQLSLMSHGCDSEDFETVLGRMPANPVVARPIAEPVLFLLNDPGGDAGLDEAIRYRGFEKRPPVKTYYWVPDCERWPTTPGEVESGGIWGTYFAYLMWRHQLRNVYITNRAKCKWRDENKRAGQPWPIVEHCVKRFLTREVEIFAPQLAFCFGKHAWCTFPLVQSVVPNCQRVGLKGYLHHPTWIERFASTQGLTSVQAIEQNDAWIEEAIIRVFLDNPNLT